MDIIKAICFVGLGGGVGSIMRYLTSVVLNRYVSSEFPWATFSANFLGCLLIGLLMGWTDRQQIMSHDLRLLLITGFCGGYTTFSAFSAENIKLIQAGHTTTALVYMVTSVMISLAAVWAGMVISK